METSLAQGIMNAPAASKAPSRLPPYQLLIFDFDGTLADSFSSFLLHTTRVIERFGLRRINPGDLETLRGLSAREVIRHLGLPFWKVPLVAREVRAQITSEIARTQLFPGIATVLQRLVEKGAVLAIVSSNSEANIRAVLGPEKAGLISVYACGASLFGKAAKFRRVLKTTGIPASRALTIGDEIRDSDAAREAGIAFGAVSWGYTHVEALRAHSPAVVFRDPEEIIEVVSGSRP